MNSASTTRWIVAFIQFWMWYGYTMIILISGVLGISPEIYEAAEIDGANDRQIFFRITIPNLRTILTYTLITSLIGGLSMYDIPKMLNNGNPNNSTLTTSVFIYNQAFAGSYMYNRAAAASMIMFVIIAFFSVIVFYLMRDRKS
jgi:multiple sugar transport system permease protein